MRLRDARRDVLKDQNIVVNDSSYKFFLQRIRSGIQILIVLRASNSKTNLYKEAQRTQNIDATYHAYGFCW